MTIIVMVIALRKAHLYTILAFQYSLQDQISSDFQASSLI